MENITCVLVGLCLLAASYALAENLSCRHTYTRSYAAKARVAWEALIWPPETLWLLLRQSPSWLAAQWAAAEPRYAGVGS